MSYMSLMGSNDAIFTSFPNLDRDAPGYRTRPQYTHFRAFILLHKREPSFVNSARFRIQ